MHVLEAFDLYRFYHTSEDETVALRGVGLRLDAGELVAIMGPSGSGKSTLLSCLAGLDEPDGGHVELMGRRLTRRPEIERTKLRARHIGVSLQNGNLFEHLTVKDNLRLQLVLAGKSDAGRLADILTLLDLDELQHAAPSQLSGGEAARAGLAVALAAGPDVLLADEPTAEVDARTEERIFEVFATRRNRGGATLVATHSLALAERADRILKILDGRIVDE
jgi:putative ABC transport system ATP-binding protein